MTTKDNLDIITREIFLEPMDNQRLLSLCGPFDDNIKQLEQKLNIEINHQNNCFKLIGKPLNINTASNVLQRIYIDTAPVRGIIPDIIPEQIHLFIMENKFIDQSTQNISDYDKFIQIKSKKGIIKPRTINQAQYITNILNHDITFGIGPSGTGKTYLAIAAAVDTLEQKKIRHILLTRPAVDAGEKLGFLPGDLRQKINPYLRPLYDALFEILGFEKVEKLIKHNFIEVAPLAYMRGRTLNDSFIILDESQNTTIEQMKMFLTRIGFNSKTVITGDITQIDLPHKYKSGLSHAIKVLSEIKELSFNFFHSDDVVRHPIVAKVIIAYENSRAKEQEHNKQLLDQQKF